jgi:hypothetical protein
VITFRKLRWAGNLEKMDEIKNAYLILTGKRTEKRGSEKYLNKKKLWTRMN